MRFRCRWIGGVTLMAVASCGVVPDTSTGVTARKENALNGSVVVSSSAEVPAVDVAVPAKVGDPSPVIKVPLWADVKRPVEMFGDEAERLMRGQYMELGPAADGTRRFTRMDLFMDAQWLDSAERPKFEVVDSLGTVLGWFTLEEISVVYTDENGYPIPRPAK